MPRWLVAVLALVVAAAGAVGLVLFFAARDEGQLSTAVSGPGVALPDACARHADGAAASGDEPVVSGPHRPEATSADRRTLTRDQVLHALELGNVVLTYPTREPPRAQVALQDDLSGPFARELAAAGQAVILRREPASRGYTALAWRHYERATRPDDPALRTFAEFWLGRGYAQAHGSNCPDP